MKRIFAILIAMLSLCGCLNEKDYAENPIVPSLIVGTWLNFRWKPDTRGMVPMLSAQSERIGYMV